MNCRKDFPIFENNLVYLDSACVSLKPFTVINKIKEYYEQYPACGERSVHKLSRKVNEEVQKARETLQKFINAKNPEEIIFTRNTTESINLVSYSFPKKGDKIVLSDREHNSNLIPWLSKQHLTTSTTPSNKDHTFNLEDFKQNVRGAKLVSIAWISNLDSYELPIREIIKISHEAGVKVLLDAAQAAPHHPINVQKLDADILALSGHKMCGPSGTGVLYAKEEILKEMKPFLLGGDTVHDSTHTTYQLAEPPSKFEAGLQDYAGIIGLGEAARYLKKQGMESIKEHCTTLRHRAARSIKKLPEAENIGVTDERKLSTILNFNLKGVNSHDLAYYLDEANNILIRSGAHCLHSWYNKHNINGSARASFYIYNTKKEADALAEAITRAAHLLKPKA